MGGVGVGVEGELKRQLVLITVICKSVDGLVTKQSRYESFISRLTNITTRPFI